MEAILVKQIKGGVLNITSWHHYQQMLKLSNKNAFTQWGFLKHLAISTVLPSWKIFAALDHNKIAGFSFTKKRFLYRLVVSKSYRGKGLGKQLIPRFINSTETNREDVVAFYTKIGYKLVEKRGKSYILKKP